MISFLRTSSLSGRKKIIRKTYLRFKVHGEARFGDRVQKDLVKSACAEVILNTCISIVDEISGVGWITLYTPTVQFSFIMTGVGEGWE